MHLLNDIWLPRIIHHCFSIPLGISLTADRNCLLHALAWQDQHRHDHCCHWRGFKNRMLDVHSGFDDSGVIYGLCCFYGSSYRLHARGLDWLRSGFHHSYHYGCQKTWKVGSYVLLCYSWNAATFCFEFCLSTESHLPGSASSLLSLCHSEWGQLHWYSEMRTQSAKRWHYTVAYFLTLAASFCSWARSEADGSHTPHVGCRLDGENIGICICIF